MRAAPFSFVVLTAAGLWGCTQSFGLEIIVRDELGAVVPDALVDCVVAYEGPNDDSDEWDFESFSGRTNQRGVCVISGETPYDHDLAEIRVGAEKVGFHPVEDVVAYPVWDVEGPTTIEVVIEHKEPCPAVNVRRCNDEHSMETCDADGWSRPTDCRSTEVCVTGPDEGFCTWEPCAELGLWKCLPLHPSAVSMECTADGWVPTIWCLWVEQCGTNGHCEPAPCEDVGDKRCVFQAEQYVATCGEDHLYHVEFCENGCRGYDDIGIPIQGYCL